MQQICIIGGGFSGCMTAVNLSRLSASPLKITIINHRHPLGRGVAYGTRNGNHLLNVAARNMSALADQPDHFVEWLGTRSEYFRDPVARIREKFMPRRVYGDYLHSVLFSQSRYAAERGGSIETIDAEAIDVIPHETGARVLLSDGKEIDAAKVILATGNPPPARLTLKGLDPAHPKSFQNPWEDWESKLTDRTENVALIGTGLTAIDVFITLQDLGWKGKIFAISRNGLLPLSHFKGSEFPNWLDAKDATLTLARAFKEFKKNYYEARQNGMNPAILVDKLRPVTQQLWQNFSLADKRRFNKRFRTWWNVTRHRIAQSIHQQLLEAEAYHRLEVVQGRLRDVSEVGDQFVLTLKTKNGLRRIEAGSIINCTGPSESYQNSSTPIYKNLFARGLIKADEMDMGIQITPDFAVVNGAGDASPYLFALGPVLKGTLWESSAVPELRSQAFRVAEVVSRQISGIHASGLKEAVHEVLEYEI